MVKKDKNISCSVSIKGSVWKTINSYKKQIEKKYTVKPNINPLVEAFLVENILPYLDYVLNNYWIPYEQFKEQILNQEVKT